MGSDNEAEKSAHNQEERKKMFALAPIAKPLAGNKLYKQTLQPLFGKEVEKRMAATVGRKFQGGDGG
ncbi:hypothetical protein AHAS_Ahas19G0087100 [Arachis hypogaea]